MINLKNINGDSPSVNYSAEELDINVKELNALYAMEIK